MENASTVKNIILAALAAIGGGIANMLGGWDAALKVLVICMAVDYITGLIVAAVFKNSGKSETGALDSRAGFKGLFKKASILLLVLVAAQVDIVTGMDSVARTAVILFYIANEGLSVVENLGLMGLEYPPFIKNALEALRDKGNSHK